jgi:hypothetical protein
MSLATSNLFDARETLSNRLKPVYMTDLDQDLSGQAVLISLQFEKLLTGVSKAWGLSSAGRAPDLHSGGQEFDPPRLHHSSIALAGSF